MLGGAVKMPEKPDPLDFGPSRRATPATRSRRSAAGQKIWRHPWEFLGIFGIRDPSVPFFKKDYRKFPCPKT